MMSNKSGVSPTDKQLHVLAPAKLNLTLDIVGRRPDGYHLLESVMQSIDVADIMTVTTTDGATVVASNGDNVPSGERNLAAQAVAALRSAVGGYDGTAARLPGLHIRIDKQIPVAAGLGGGSADAAAALVAANTLWDLQLSEEQLAGIGVQIGADVPFCLHGGTVIARGIGEQLAPVSDVPELSGVLVNPGLPVSTAAVYRRFSEQAPHQPDMKASERAEAMVAALCQGDVAAVGQLLYNALESVTTVMHPAIGVLRQRVLDVGALGAVMCGSGPTVFGLAQDAEHAAVLAARLQRDARYVAVCRFLRQGSRVIEAERCV